VGRLDVEGFRRQTDLATRALVLVMVTTLGGIVVGSRFIVAVIWGDEFAQAADLLPVLLLAVLGTTIGVASVDALSTRSQRGMVVASGASLAGLAVGAIVWAVLARGHGVMGIALGYLAGTTVVGGGPPPRWRARRERKRCAGRRQAVQSARDRATVPTRQPIGTASASARDTGHVAPGSVRLRTSCAWSGLLTAAQSGELNVRPREIQMTSGKSTVQIDNGEVLAKRWTLAPGEEIGEHRHEHPYVVVPLAAGVVHITTPDGAHSTAEMQPGVSYHRPAGAQHTLRNGGSGVIDFVEIEILTSA
jgi:quercetin dioxygenase-like cupin family protein